MHSHTLTQPLVPILYGQLNSGTLNIPQIPKFTATITLPCSLDPVNVTRMSCAAAGSRSGRVEIAAPKT